jgi:undecaprenyl phosphate N,N'-diacetylbacillosamine 1-phosphate transferase
LLPVFLIVALLIKIQSPGEVFYRQIRIGKNHKPFKIYKFRSMVKDAEFKGAGLYMEGENDARITSIGKFIRKTSVDELPQIINVLMGDMSIVGPRPMIEIMYSKLSQIQKERSSMLPGITGLAQVNGRNDLKWSKRIEYDIQYCKEFTIALDIKIIFKTVKVIFTHEGVRMDQSEEEIDDLSK